MTTAVRTKKARSEDPETVEHAEVQGAEASAALATASPRLKEIRLPDGDVGSINIGWFRNGAAINLDPSTWLGEGYQGVRIVGNGPDRTHLRLTAWDGITFAVGRHPGVVQLEEVTIHAGPNNASSARGVAFGEQNLARTVTPEFRFNLYNARAVVEEPLPGNNIGAKWLLFGYQSDVHLRHVELDAFFAAEHAAYWHGVARQGILWDRVRMESCGAEGCKLRSDASETAWVPGAWLILRDCTLKNWYQQHSWRGGGAITVQGGHVNVLVERTTFWPGRTGFAGIPVHERSRCISVSSEGLSYNVDNGAVGSGFGNGWVFVRRCGMAGGPGPSWGYKDILYVDRNGGGQPAAKGVVVSDCGIYGDRMSVKLSQVPRGLVQRCNTPAIRNYLSSLGMPVDHEAVIITPSRLIPVSEGYEFGGQA